MVDVLRERQRKTRKDVRATKSEKKTIYINKRQEMSERCID